MDRPRRPLPLTLPRCSALTLLPVAAGLALASPLRAQPPTSATPTVVRSVAPEPRPNPALESALRGALFPERGDCEAVPTHRYTWDRVDLNGDGTPEVVAQVLGPMLCGTGGCPLLIFREPSPGRLELITRMSLFKDPLIVAARPHNGWSELITRVRVDAGTGYYAELQYDGRTYPTNPSVAPAIPLRRPEPGTAYLEWNDKDPRAHALPCRDAPLKRGL